jgi:hypothetical protein
MYDGTALPCCDYTQPQLRSGYRPADDGPVQAGKQVYYGLVVQIQQDVAELGGVLKLGHSGYYPGFRISLFFYPASGAAVVVQVNTSADGKVGPLALELAKVLLPLLLLQNVG